MARKEVHIFGRPIGILAVTAYKFIWGISECLAGIFVLRSNIYIRKELAEDPEDVFANWLLRHAHINPSTATHLGVLFLILGAVKILLAVGVWRSSWTLRKILMYFLCIITVYACVDMLVRFTAVKLFSLGSDMVILYYIWHILPKHLRHHEAKPTVAHLENF